MAQYQSLNFISQANKGQRASSSATFKTISTKESLSSSPKLKYFDNKNVLSLKQQSNVAIRKINSVKIPSPKIEMMENQNPKDIVAKQPQKENSSQVCKNQQNKKSPHSYQQKGRMKHMKIKSLDAQAINKIFQNTNPQQIRNTNIKKLTFPNQKDSQSKINPIHCFNNFIQASKLSAKSNKTKKDKSNSQRIQKSKTNNVNLVGNEVENQVYQINQEIPNQLFRQTQDQNGNYEDIELIRDSQIGQQNNQTKNSENLQFKTYDTQFKLNYLNNQRQDIFRELNKVLFPQNLGKKSIVVTPENLIQSKKQLYQKYKLDVQYLNSKLQNLKLTNNSQLNLEDYQRQEIIKSRNFETPNINNQLQNFLSLS